MNPSVASHHIHGGRTNLPDIIRRPLSSLRSSFLVVAPFSSPKPVRLLKNILTLCTSQDDLVMDFFAGSATFAEAVFTLNAEDSANRRFILV